MDFKIQVGFDRVFDFKGTKIMNFEINSNFNHEDRLDEPVLIRILTCSKNVRAVLGAPKRCSIYNLKKANVF